MNLPDPHNMSFSSLKSDIKKGLVKIPQFQRDFVWTKQKSAKLLDSIVKGYPIGTFILWKTKESLRAIRNIGGDQLPDTPKGDFIQYVLDGQQRLTSLYASIMGLNVAKNNRVEDFSEIYIDLMASNENDIVLTDVSDKEPNSVIKIVDLINQGITFFSNYPQTLHKKIEDYKLQISSYSFSCITLKEAPIEVATEVFTRINVSGKPLSVFEIMVAKTFDKKKDFDLAEKFDELIIKLENVNYDTLSDATVLQTISVILSRTKECKKKDILKLNKKKFIDLWPDAIEAIEKTVDYFRSFYRIPVSKLLPYNALIIPFAYFFYHHKDKPTGDKQKYLQDFFWRCSLTGRYSSSLESKVAQDIKKIDSILKNKRPNYDSPVDIRPDFIQTNGSFSAGRSFIKAILCIYAYQQPKSFIDNSLVNISNDWLKQANSKNYHHFFPKAYLKKQKEEDFYINHILNITLVDDFLNKRVIRAKRPSIYMKDFAKKNEDLDKTMKSHLININRDGIWDDDYNTFFVNRAKAVSRLLKQRIIPDEIDKKGQKEFDSDFEESELNA
ncbi:MAG: DUF262 domain-containing protein [Candidatus Scalinduaceae bacterium]